MFKLFIATLLTLSINTVGVQKSQAAVGGVVALFGASSAGGGIAIIGLGSVVLGVGVDIHDDDGGPGVGILVFGTLGLIIMNEDSVEQLSLDSLEEKHFKNAGLSSSQIFAVKNNKEELEAVFTEAMKDRHVDLAAARFEEAKAILGEDAITGLHKLLTTQI